MISYRPDLKIKSRELRREMTKEERHLWYDFLRAYPIRFHRQKAFLHYVVDFYCAKAKMAVELDGGQHFVEDGLSYDENRTHELHQAGIEVLRFSNRDVWENFSGVCEKIDAVVKERLSKQGKELPRSVTT